ncbi:heterokaryon incompatibility protein (HET) domain-containing protein [Sarocladium implicatum]|nr:heterokaryon incompatibility protein (HET) domain-containing protein [Sarocladium implicatum]
MDALKYKPLDFPGKSIRALRVAKGAWFNDIHCELFETLLAKAEGCPYVALSYTWGGTQQKGWHNPMFINGCHVQVTQNLHDALRHIRSQHRDVILWIDALCINQDDHQEKSQQVAMMGDIYRAAEEVIVWLGPAMNHVSRLFDTITAIDEEAAKLHVADTSASWGDLCRQNAAELWQDPLHMHAVAKLLDRRWFSRTWIIQEIAFAKAASIRCGPYVCPARTFAVMPRLVLLRVKPSTQAILDVMPRMRRNTWWSSQRDLHSLLCKFAQSEATRPVDQVYALLGISSDACIHTRFYPDYGKDAQEVFRDAASFVVFGRVLGPDYELPSYSREQLTQPISVIAYRIFGLGLTNRYDQDDIFGPILMSIQALIDQLNEDEQRTRDLLPLIFSWSNHKEDFLRLLSLGRLEVQFPAQPLLRPHLRVRSLVDCAGEESYMDLELPEIAPDQSLLSPPFKDFSNMKDAITHLRLNGASDEELLRAYVWKRDPEGVQAQLDVGADPKRKDAAGHSAINLAERAQYPEILQLLRPETSHA